MARPTLIDIIGTDQSLNWVPRWRNMGGKGAGTVEQGVIIPGGIVEGWWWCAGAC